MIFEGTRANVTHRYDVTQAGLKYSAGTTTQVFIPWNELKGLGPNRGAPLALTFGPKRKLCVWLDDDVMRRFLPALFEAWGKSHPEAARKAAFDYGSEERAMGWIWLAVSLLFPGLLALLLLTDGYHTLHCNHMLENSKLASGKVLKVKKDNRGNIVWNLEFQTESGLTIKGRRAAYTYDAKGNPTSGATVVYSTEDPKCWDLSVRPNENALNKKQRRFGLVFALSFGWVFAAIALLSIAASLRRLRRRHPYKDVLLEIFAEQLRHLKH